MVLPFFHISSLSLIMTETSLNKSRKGNRMNDWLIVVSVLFRIVHTYRDVLKMLQQGIQLSDGTFDTCLPIHFVATGISTPDISFCVTYIISNIRFIDARVSFDFKIQEFLMVNCCQHSHRLKRK